MLLVHGFLITTTALNTYGPISEWDTSTVTDMTDLFNGKTSFNDEYISGWDISSVVYCYNMFSGCTAFNQDIGSWNTSSLIHCYNMFYGCTAFNNGDNNNQIEHWNLSSIGKGTDSSIFSSMFEDAVAFTRDIRSWTMPDPTLTFIFTNMFNGATAFLDKYKASDGWGDIEHRNTYH